MNTYRMKSIRQLFLQYADENTRINQADAEHTQALIEEELKRRLKATLSFLDQATTETEALKIYKQFLEH